jgi:hypothetical protein
VGFPPLLGRRASGTAIGPRARRLVAAIATASGSPAAATTAATVALTTPIVALAAVAVGRLGTLDV